MHLVPANYTLPTVLNTLKPPANIGTRTTAGARATGTTGSGSTTNSDDGVNSIGSTFLSLLSTELQNQDPTAPVDSTAMVGQMISLNQLDQLININQTLTGDTTGTTASLKKPAATASDTAASSASGGLANSLRAAVGAAAMSALPFDPTTMMPLNPGSPTGTGASANSSFNPASINFSTANSTTSGGK